MIFAQHLYVLTELLPKWMGPSLQGWQRWRWKYCLSALFSTLLCVLLPGWLAGAAMADTMRVGWYGPGFDGDYTANGEVFSRYEYTAAHPSWPFDTLIQLTNPNNGATVVVRVNDRSGGALDISEQAARDLETYSTGISAVEVKILRWGE